MRLVIARCTVDYDGRLTAHLPDAIRLLMVKADGCVAIHADGGAYKPLNWMNSPNTLTVDDDPEAEDARAVWTVRNPGGETLTITLHEVLSDEAHEMGLDPGWPPTRQPSSTACALSGGNIPPTSGRWTCSAATPGARQWPSRSSVGARSTAWNNSPVTSSS